MLLATAIAAGRAPAPTPRLIAALHRWFAAQGADHGAHAVHEGMHRSM